MGWTGQQAPRAWQCISSFKNPACLPSHHFTLNVAEKYVFGWGTFILWSCEICISPDDLFLATYLQCIWECWDRGHFPGLDHAEVTFGINLLVITEGLRDPLGEGEL